MRRALAVILVIFLGACAAEPPERATLPDLAEVLDEPVGCQLSVGEPRGVAIVSVIEPSAASGILEEGDVITEVDGVATVTRSDLTDIMAGHSPEDVVEFGFIRDGEAETATITLGANPNEPSRAMIGITIETAFDQIAPDQADDVVAPSDTARPIHIGETLLLFDPLRNTWQQTGIVPPADTRWVSTSTGIYSVEGEDDVSIVDLMSGETIEDDGYQGWEPLRLIGTVGQELIVVISSDVPDQPGFVNLAIAGFNPISGIPLTVSTSTRLRLISYRSGTSLKLTWPWRQWSTIRKMAAWDAAGNATMTWSIFASPASRSTSSRPPRWRNRPKSPAWSSSTKPTPRVHQRTRTTLTTTAAARQTTAIRPARFGSTAQSRRAASPGGSLSESSFTSSAGPRIRRDPISVEPTFSLDGLHPI